MNKKYIYICAAGHSGSTLLDLLLGSHSMVESLGEITQLPKNIALNTICMCGQPVKNCTFWRKVLYALGKNISADLFAQPYSLNLGFINAQVIIDKKHQNTFYNIKRKILRAVEYAMLSFGPIWIQKAILRLSQSILNNFRLYDYVIHLQSVDCIVDSSKDYLKAIKLYLERPKEVKLIFLVRDGRGVFYSNIKRNNSTRESLLAWLNHNKRALKLFNRHIPPIDLLIVKYEDLSTATCQTLTRICKFIGIDYENKMLNFIENPHHIANGNNMRFANSSKIKLDVSWKEQLTDSDLRYFSKLAGPTNKILGYLK